MDGWLWIAVALETTRTRSEAQTRMLHIVEIGCFLLLSVCLVWGSKTRRDTTCAAFGEAVGSGLIMFDLGRCGDGVGIGGFGGTKEGSEYLPTRLPT